jgi:hypothetical protein
MDYGSVGNTGGAKGRKPRATKKTDEEKSEHTVSGMAFSVNVWRWISGSEKARKRS